MSACTRCSSRATGAPHSGLVSTRGMMSKGMMRSSAYRRAIDREGDADARKRSSLRPGDWASTSGGVDSSHCCQELIAAAAFAVAATNISLNALAMGRSRHAISPRHPSRDYPRPTCKKNANTRLSAEKSERWRFRPRPRRGHRSRPRTTARSAAGSLTSTELMSSRRPSKCSAIAVQLSTQSPQLT